jgi:hypothetical protein
MNPIKFTEIKDKIQEALQEKLKETPIPNEKGFALIEGFMRLPIYAEISNNLIIGGPNVPIVGIVGNTSGRLYTFALKVIFPDIQI